MFCEGTVLMPEANAVQDVVHINATVDVFDDRNPDRVNVYRVMALCRPYPGQKCMVHNLDGRIVEYTVPRALAEPETTEPDES